MNTSVMTTDFEKIDGRNYAIFPSPKTKYIAKVKGIDTDYPEEQRLWYIEVDSFDDAKSQVAVMNEEYEYWDWKLIFVRRYGSPKLIKSQKAFLQQL